MIAPFIRILLRVGAGGLMMAGYIDRDALPLFADPALVGGLTLAITEGWYLAARRFGWSK